MSSEATKPITTNRRHLIARRVIAPVDCCLRRVERPRRIRLASGSCRWQRNGSFRVPTTSYAAGTIKPSTAQSTMDSATLAFTPWKSRYFGFRVRQRKRHHVTGRRPPVRCRSPGVTGWSYLRSWLAQIPMRRLLFDSVLKFVLAHPSSITPGLLAAEQDSSCKSVNGSDSATDGDLAVAYGLLLADRQWGSAGAYNLQEPRAVADRCHQGGEIIPTTHLPLLGDWSSPGDKYYNSTRPSDFMIDHFRAFKAATGDTTWDQVIAATSGLVTAQQNTYAPTTD